MRNQISVKHKKYDVVTELDRIFVFPNLRYRFVQLMAITLGLALELEFSFVCKLHIIVNELFYQLLSMSIHP